MEKDLRANDSSDESTKRQLTCSIIRKSSSLSASLACAIARTGFAVLGTGQHGDGDEGSYEGKIEND